MKQQIKTLSVMFILLLSSLSFISFSNAEQVMVTSTNTFYVGGTGPGNYTKIQDAIDVASDDDTVYVYSGTYFENLLINKSITLEGENQENTILQGNGLTHAINVKTNNVTINKLSITNNNNLSGINVNSNINVIISHCNIYLCDVGIKFFGLSAISTKNIVENCKIFLNNNGIEITTDFFTPDSYMVLDFFFEDLKDISIKNCDIYSNKNTGVIITYSRNNKITSCNIYENGRGIALIGCKNNEIVNCYNYLNNISIAFYVSSSNTIIDCNITLNEIGIYLNTSFYNTIKNCKYNDNEHKIEKNLNPHLLFAHILFKIGLVSNNMIWFIVYFFLFLIPLTLAKILSLFR